MKEEKNMFLFYGVLLLAVVSVLGSLFVFQMTQDVQTEMESGHSSAGGTVSLRITGPSYESSAETTGRVTLTVAEPE